MPYTYLSPFAQPSNNPPRILLSLSSDQISQGTILRLDPDGRYRPVRGAEPAVLAGGSWVGYDYEAPFGVEVTYVADTPELGRVTAINTAQLNVTDMWLRHPGTPSLSTRIQVIARFEAETYATARGVFRPIGAEYPVVVTDGQRKAAESELVLRTRTAAELDALKTVLADSSVLLLSIPPSRDWGITHEYISIGDVAVARFLRYAADPRRDITLPYLVVGRPAGGFVGQWTYAGVTTGFASYADLAPTFRTYLNLAGNFRSA